MNLFSKWLGAPSSSHSIPNSKATKIPSLKTAKSPAHVKVEGEEFRAHVVKITSIKRALVDLVESRKIYERDWKDLYRAQQVWSENFRAKYPDTDEFAELANKAAHHMAGLEKLHDVRVKGVEGGSYMRMNDQLMKYLGELNAIETAYAPLELKQKELERVQRSLERYEKGLSKDKSTVDSTSDKLESLTRSMQELEDEKELERAQIEIDKESLYLDKFSSDFKKQQERVEKQREDVEYAKINFKLEMEELLVRMKNAEAKARTIFRSGLAANWLGFEDFSKAMENHCSDFFIMAKDSKEGFVAMNPRNVSEYDHPVIRFKGEVMKPPPRPSDPVHRTSNSVEAAPNATLEDARDQAGVQMKPPVSPQHAAYPHQSYASPVPSPSVYPTFPSSSPYYGGPASSAPYHAQYPSPAPPYTPVVYVQGPPQYATAPYVTPPGSPMPGQPFPPTSTVAGGGVRNDL
eukprot:CAMPEP_0184683110 /NCGR_PEP_ID=MMETSP0312-20130426/9976_1 /TAXON_ID=31354 /ORGANISM="Compsopogon coeruleus, Strain SAG 36.94" /LENGTH=461 /DNA_ID=CAMNT_0027135199 /DNA_START=126 /DNA_END=1511 /DNA_ORIENTATION=+